MRKPLTALTVLAALLAGACGNNGTTTAAAEKIIPDPAALAALVHSQQAAQADDGGAQADGSTTGIAPIYRDLTELSPAVLYDVPDDVMPTDGHGPRPEWKGHDWHMDNVFALGTITAVDRGETGDPIPEGEPRDPVGGDYRNLRPCQPTDRCLSVHVHIKVERAYPAGAVGDEVVVSMMPIGDFVSFASAMLALGRGVFILSSFTPRGRPKPSMREMSLNGDQEGVYTVAADGTLALPFADPELAARSLAVAPTVDRLFDVLAVERTIPLRYQLNSGMLERAD